jgi:hypothetical protein
MIPFAILLLDFLDLLLREVDLLAFSFGMIMSSIPMEQPDGRFAEAEFLELVEHDDGLLVTAVL